ncbi:hypothetical protein AOLI_G00078240 [Acnodon oligacanthus]
MLKKRYRRCCRQESLKSQWQVLAGGITTRNEPCKLTIQERNGGMVTKAIKAEKITLISVESWSRTVVSICRAALPRLQPRHIQTRSSAPCTSI